MEYVTPRKASEIMGVSLTHVRGLISSGKLPASNISLSAKCPRWRVNVDDIASYMDSKKRVVVAPKRKSRDTRFDNDIQFV